MSLPVNSGVRVLIVDDEPEICDYIRYHLKKLSITQSALAEDGVEALRICQEAAEKNEPFDIIYSDWLMPRGRGDEFVKKLRASTAYAQTPIIVLTAVESALFPEDAAYDARLQILMKPFTPEQLDLATSNALLQVRK